jgi:hypothetical protein
LDENDETGYPALRQLLAVGTGNFAGLRPEPGEKIDLVPNLNFELHKVIPLMPALPESPVGLFDEKSLLDKVFSTGSFEKLEQMRPTEPARPRDMEPMLPPAKPLGPLPPMQMPNSPQFQMPTSPQVQMPGTPQMQMPGAPQVQMPGTPQMQMPNNSPQVQMPGTPQGQMPQMPGTVTPQKPIPAFVPTQTPQSLTPPPMQMPSAQAPPVPAWQTARTQPVQSLDIPDEEFETLEREKEQAQRDTKRPASMPVTYEGLDDLQVRPGPKVPSANAQYAGKGQNSAASPIIVIALVTFLLLAQVGAIMFWKPLNAYLLTKNIHLPGVSAPATHPVVSAPVTHSPLARRTTGNSPHRH